jgi:hypothetical protein
LLAQLATMPDDRRAAVLATLEDQP